MHQPITRRLLMSANIGPIVNLKSAFTLKWKYSPCCIFKMSKFSLFVSQIPLDPIPRQVNLPHLN